MTHTNFPLALLLLALAAPACATPQETPGASETQGGEGTLTRGTGADRDTEHRDQGQRDTPRTRKEPPMTVRRWALVLGSSSGFGAATSIRLARDGFDLAGPAAEVIVK